MTKPRSCVRAGAQTSGHIHDLALFHVVSLELADDAPFAHDDHAIAHPDDLFQLARDEDDGSSLCRQLREETVDLLFRGHVHAARGLVDHHHARPRVERLREEYLLLVPAGERLQRRSQVACLDAEAVAPGPCLRHLLVAIDHEGQRGVVPERNEGHVLRDAEAGEDARTLAVLREIPETLAHRLLRISRPGLLAAHAHHARRGPQSHERLGDLRPPCSDQTRKAEDLAFPHREGDVGERAGRAQAADLQDDGSHGLPLRREDLPELAADHAARHFRRLDLGDGRLADELAVLEDHHAIADRLHLRKLVRDVDQRHAARLERAHEREEAVDLAPGEHGGGFVEDQQARVERQRLAHFDELLLRRAQALDPVLRRHVGAELREELRGADAHPRPVEHPAKLEQLGSEEDVLLDAQVLGEVELLRDDAHPGAPGVRRAVERDRSALELQGAGGRFVDAGEDLHERRLPRAVLADEPEDLPAVDLRIDVPYSDPFGHRGATHSLVFAVLAGTVTALLLSHGGRRDFWRTAVVTCLVAVSHPLLDAMTNGGLGVALLWPLSNARFFAPWRPIPVAPIGARMLSARGLHVILVEALWSLPVLAWALWPRVREPRFPDAQAGR